MLLYKYLFNPIEGKDEPNDTRIEDFIKKTKRTASLAVEKVLRGKTTYLLELLKKFQLDSALSKKTLSRLEQ